MSIILGVDPGSRVTGFGLIEKNQNEIKFLSCGVIQADPHQQFHSRLVEMGKGLRQILRKFEPDAVAIENIFLGRNADSAFKLGHARGVILYESQSFGCQIFEYATRVVKKGLTGKGSADKVEVQNMLERFLNLSKIKKIDASDALALAVFHALHEEQSLKISKLRENESGL